MNIEKYLYEANEDRTTFTFESLGPNGTISKTIKYFEVGRLPDGTPILNLGFGDADDSPNEFNDSITSNNGDRSKVLATVANTIFNIFSHWGNAVILAIGGTPARNRLYQMGINANKAEIDSHFDILGRTPMGWEYFRKGVNYTAFMAKKKNYKIE